MPDDFYLLNLLLLNQILLFWVGCATTVLVTGAGVGEMSLQMLVGWVCGKLGGRETNWGALLQAGGKVWPTTF